LWYDTFVKFDAMNLLINSRRWEIMASICEVCGKGTMSGNNVSHSNRHTKRAWKPNIQQVRAVVDGQTKRVNVCTRCLRSGKVNRAI